MDYGPVIKKQIEDGVILRQSLADSSALLIAIAGELVKVFKSGGKLVIFGNGGSAADAQHIAAELMGKFYLHRQPLPALALSCNTSTLTAIGNDDGYDEVFVRQVKGLIRQGDAALGLSTSGNSRNVILAMEEARKMGAVTIALTGAGGKLKELATFCLAVPSTDTPRIQEAHITAGHIICYMVEQSLFGAGQGV
jgi:D-sedoheptulose 7-phosphate isomerase